MRARRRAGPRPAWASGSDGAASDGAGWMDGAGGTDGVACAAGGAGVGGTATAWRAIAAATPGSGLFATGPSDGTGGRSDAGGAWWTGRPPGACECAW